MAAPSSNLVDFFMPGSTGQATLDTIWKGKKPVTIASEKSPLLLPAWKLVRWTGLEALLARLRHALPAPTQLSGETERQLEQMGC